MSDDRIRRNQADGSPATRLRWRSILVLCGACAAALAASLAVAFTDGSAQPVPKAQRPALVLQNKLGKQTVTKRIPWPKLPSDVIWNGRKDPDNRHADLQAVFRGQSLYKLVGLVDDRDPTTFNVRKAKRGYTIKLIGDDGFSATMKSRQIIGKRKWIVAKLKNGKPLPEGEGPYRPVGSFVGFNARESVKMLVRIELVRE